MTKGTRGFLIAWICCVMFATTSSAQVPVIERMLMPGPVISGHAETEAQCDACHARFERERQRDLCLSCHENVASDLQGGTGFHGLAPDVAAASGRCASCHTDHEGRDFDIVGLDEAAFEHDFTDFPLRESHREVECVGCHAIELPHHEAAATCAACHVEDDRHRGNLGEACADCHTETTWADVQFDHELTTGYALNGGHAGIPCVSCHLDEEYQGTASECVGCHLQDDSHAGLNGRECESCHTTSDWQRVLFDHFVATGFALTDGHGGLVCEACHSGNKFEERTATECAGCHRDDDAHEGINGPDCANCHNSTDWLDVRFDHFADTGFALNGAHAKLDCADCHTAAIDIYAPPTTCFGCHEPEDPHAGQLGQRCETCHGEVGWALDVRFDHDLGAFPLIGQHRLAACGDCHETPAFLDAPGSCVDCHREDDVHGSALGLDCGLCHSPVDWQRWNFDHARETRFGLDGAHADLACDGCHRAAVSATGDISLPMDCGGCHRSDDIHRGDFGLDCERCHSTTSFRDLRFVP